MPQVGDHFGPPSIGALHALLDRGGFTRISGDYGFMTEDGEHSNRQKHVIVIANMTGKVWVIGTDTQRGFTEAGAKSALSKLEASLPHGWSVWEAELYPIGQALAFNRR